MAPRLALSFVVGGLIFLVVAETISKPQHTPDLPGVLGGFGLIAVYTLVWLVRRLTDSSYQMERLLAELEQAQEGEMRAVALAERQRLAREMHDVLAHSLSGLALQLEGARLLAVKGPADPRLADAVERAHHLAKSGLQEARRAIGMLRDEELPGPDRLAALAAEFARDSGLSCAFTVDGDQHELDSQARLALYRVAQEALTNVRKHSRADRVEVHLGYEPHGTRLTVEDFGADGLAPPPAAASNGNENGGGGSRGYGLTGMRERAELLGGRLTVTPANRGYRVELWVPAGDTA